jgi:hypothetical protein
VLSFNEHNSFDTELNNTKCVLKHLHSRAPSASTWFSCLPHKLQHQSPPANWIPHQQVLVTRHRFGQIDWALPCWTSEDSAMLWLIFRHAFNKQVIQYIRERQDSDEGAIGANNDEAMDAGFADCFKDGGKGVVDRASMNAFKFLFHRVSAMRLGGWSNGRVEQIRTSVRLRIASPTERLRSS